MSNITIGRYDNPPPAGPEGGTWSGWVEGQDSDGKSWIMFLDSRGPARFVLAGASGVRRG